MGWAENRVNKQVHQSPAVAVVMMVGPGNILGGAGVG